VIVIRSKLPAAGFGVDDHQVFMLFCRAAPGCGQIRQVATNKDLAAQVGLKCEGSRSSARFGFADPGSHQELEVLPRIIGCSQALACPWPDEEHDSTQELAFHVAPL